MYTIIVHACTCRIMDLQTRLSRRTVQKLALALPPSMLLATHGRALAQEATPGALPADVQQFADDTYAFVNGGYISLFIVTDDGSSPPILGAKGDLSEPRPTGRRLPR